MNFIAEISSNHNKSIDRCFKFIDIASYIGCDSIKFQLFKIEKLFSQEILSRSEEHRKRKEWELPEDFLKPLSNYSRSKGLNFSCTPFDLDAVDTLFEHVDFYKIASYELLWDDLLAKCASTGKDVVISTGMANTNEIKHAVEVLKLNGCKNPKILHCVSSYPTPIDECNLSAISTIRDLTGCEIGWSDHSVNKSVIERAIHHWNAKIIEFHLDLDGNGEEFSPGHCWLPETIGPIIKSFRESLIADGNGIKEPTKSELADRDWRTDPADGLRPMKNTRNNFINQFYE